MSEHVDVLIVGAGLSGIGAAHHIQAAFPDKTYIILEARDVIGGTWDLFRYPGVRSDSDMDSRGYDMCVPVNDDPTVTEQPLLDFSAGYVLRSIDQFPRAGSHAPWRLGMSYAHDVVTLRHGKINDGSMRFSRLTEAEAPPEVAGFTASRSA